MGSPAGSSSSPGVNPIGAMNYIPQFQPQADKSYTDLVNSLITQYQGPPGQQTQSLINQYLSGLGQPGGLPFGAQQALTGAQNAAADYGQFANTFGVQDPAALQQMGQTLPQGLIQMGQSLPQGLIQMGQTLPKGLEQMGAGFPRQLVAAGNQTAKQLWGMGKQTQQQAFDPQSALYNQQAGLAQQNATAAEAAGGLQGTPYGASMAANAVNNFNLNWQNNALQRMIAGGQAAGADFAGAQQAKSSGLMNAEAVRQAAYGSAEALRQSAYGGAEALRQGAYSGAENLASGAFGSAQNLAQTSDQALASTSGLPYQGGTQIAQNAVQAEAARMAMPAQALGALESYLGLGQSAALNSGALGNLGFNQQMQGIGGSIAGANALLGPQGLFSSGGSGPLSGIFGTSAAAVPGAGADFAGTVGGAGADLGSLAPFSLGPSIGGPTGVGGSALAQAGLAPFTGT